LFRVISSILAYYLIRRIYILLLCIALTASAVAAEISHQPGFWLAAGEHSLMVSDPAAVVDVQNGVGFTTSVGFDYRLQAGHFLMNTGLGVAYNRSSLRSADSQTSLPNSIDQDGYDFTFVYQFADRKDTYSSLELQLPVMFGAQFSGFYFLLGGKLSYRPIGWTNAALQVSSYGDYPQFLDPFTGMPEHQYFGARPLLSATCSLQPSTSPLAALNATASAEIGYTIALPSSGKQKLLRIALYADYGIRNMMPFFRGEPTSSPMVVPATFDYTDMYSPLRINPVLSTSSSSAILRDLSVGVKLSYAVSVSKKRFRSSGPCRCVND